MSFLSGRAANRVNYKTNEKWYQAMRVIQSIVGVLTIPITSAVCSSAAAAYAQYSTRSEGLSLRQMMVLADRGWTDPKTYLRLLSWKGFKRSGSTFLLLAIALNVLGGLVQPLQQIFLKDITIKTPLHLVKLYHIFDVTNAFRFAKVDDGSVVLMTRSALETTSIVEPINQLWQGAGFTCDAAVLDETDNPRVSIGGGTPAACGYGATLGNFSGLTDPFLAQLPSTFSSGVVRQFLPRWNSSTTYRNISFTDWPSECSTADGSYFVSYANSDIVNPWAVADFGEILYLNISRADAGQLLKEGGSLFKIVVNTTGGYFELPNYMNEETPGPLLDADPNEYCDSYCETQGLTLSDYKNSAIYDPSTWKRQDDYDLDELAQVPNKGPLLTIAMALFGNGSFIADRVAFPDKYITVVEDGKLVSGTCVDFAPLQFFQQVVYGYNDYSSGSQCIANNDTMSMDDLQGGISLWLRHFQVNEAYVMENAFNAAAFLATKAWMENQVNPAARTLTVTMDMGADTQVPSMSPAGVYTISILLAIFLLCLFAMALYSTWQVRWTSQLDSFAMMRVGAAVKDYVPLLVGRHVEKVAALDRLPGWLGDEDPDADIGTLGIGARNALRKGRRYQSYDGDDESWSHVPDGASRTAYMEIRMEELRNDLKNDRGTGT